VAAYSSEHAAAQPATTHAAAESTRSLSAAGRASSHVGPRGEQAALVTAPAPNPRLASTVATCSVILHLPQFHTVATQTGNLTAARCFLTPCFQRGWWVSKNGAFLDGEPNEPAALRGTWTCPCAPPWPLMPLSLCKPRRATRALLQAAVRCAIPATALAAVTGVGSS
jgi:hypothetical protein